MIFHKKKTILEFCFLLIVSVFCFACNSNEPNVETLSLALTIATSNVTSNGVTCNVSITSDTSKLNITEKGVCYGTSSNPTVANGNTILYQGKEISYTLMIENLEPATQYNVRGYAKTKDGYFYSDIAQIKTPESISDYDPTNIVNQYEGYTLSWSDEFNVNGRPSSDWGYEVGYVRNNEAQYYTNNSEDNSVVKDGCLVITARKDNGGYSYTSSSLTTKNSHAFMYGRFEIRAKIPVKGGSWPAIWTVGNEWNWPSGGEIDIMEYYTGNILANAAWGSSKQWTAIWDSSKKPVTYFTNKDADWLKKFHVWRMDWDYDYMRIYLDGELMNEIDLSKTVNQGGYLNNKENPFRYYDATFGQYIILNLALGGNNGGAIDDSAFPMEYDIDYVRVYKSNK